MIDPDLAIPGYPNLERLSVGTASRVHRARPEADRPDILLKITGFEAALATLQEIEERLS